MRTKFTVSMAAAGALLATVAMPMAAQESSVRAEKATSVERELFAAGNNSNVRRPMVGKADELVAKSA
jgi:hypothetical protein